MTTNTRVWGHRGCRGAQSPPENSLAAFRDAIGQGASGIELDVFLSGDNHLVVFHDERLERMTNGSGHVSSLTLSELKQLRLKDWRGELTDQEIPTLDEVFALVEGCRTQLTESLADPERVEQFVVNVEIKGSGIASHVEEAIKGRLGTNWNYRNVLVSSFEMGSLEEMRNSNPNIPVGILLEGPVGNAREPWDIELKDLKRCLEVYGDLHPQTVNITLPSLTNEAAEVIRAIGAIPVAWTWNEAPPNTLPDQSRRAIAEHVRRNSITVITDYPAQMIKLLTPNY
jgi:glycerophosphoryl diester phosphodiesterase